MMKFDPTRPSITQGSDQHVTPQVLAASEMGDRPVDVDTRPKLPDGARWNADGTITVTLEEPYVLQTVEGGNAPIQRTEAITLRPLRSGDVIDMMDIQGQGARSFFLVMRSSGLVGPVGEQTLRGLSLDDWETLSRTVEVFTKRGRKTSR